MSLTEQLFGGSTAPNKGGLAPSGGGGVAGLDFAPVKNTDINLFARAPQVKKLTRKEKGRMRRAAEMQEAAKSKSNKAKGSATSSAAAAGAESSGQLFEEVFATDEVERELAAEEASKMRKSKRQVLRHALHKNEEEDARTVFVGNLPNIVQKREVERIFKDCGAIESVRVRCQALEIPDEKIKNAGRAVRVLRGEIKKDDKYSATAYVLFRTADCVAMALEKNGVVFKERHIVVTTLDAASTAYAPETSIFIGNIAYDTTEEDVWNFFVEKGVTDVKRVRLIRDRDSGDCKGFGYVEFQNRSSVKPAIDTRGSALNGREIRIVHVNKSKDVKAATAQRRDLRKAQGSGASYSNSDRASFDRKRFRDGDDARVGKGKRVRNEAAGPSSNGGASWMGVTTNPRKKIPCDLRELVDGKREKPSGPRAPVKRKVRNPEK